MADTVRPVIERDEDSLTLAFDDERIQSRMRLDDPTALDLPYSQAMMAALMFVPQPRRVLMIGLGGGSLVRHIHHHLPQVDLTVVEIAPEVIALRETFQVPPDGDRLRVVCADGVDFVAQSDAGQYDLILLDAFDLEGQPERLSTMAFYKSCRTALAPGGMLVANLLDQEPLCSRLIGRIWQVFGESVLPLDVECGGNRIVLASDDAVFRDCAGHLRARWVGLAPVHQAMLDGLTEVLEEELQPWLPVRRPAAAPGGGGASRSPSRGGKPRKRR